MPRTKRANKARQGPMTLEDMNTLGFGDELELVAVYGSLEAAYDRYEHLRDSGQLEPKSEVFWIVAGPEHLRTFDAWRVAAGIAPPTTVEQQIDLHDAFDRARDLWWEQR